MLRKKLSVDRLSSGDIILVQNSGVLAQLVRFGTDIVRILNGYATKAKWNHTLLFVAPNILVEAVPRGAYLLDGGQVQSYDISRFTVALNEDIQVLRVRNRITNHQMIAAKAALLAHSRVGNKYDLSGIFRVAFPAPADAETNFQRYLCSELVLESFRQSGLSLFDEIGHDSLPPDELVRSQKLCVVENAVIEVSIPEAQAKPGRVVQQYIDVYDTP